MLDAKLKQKELVKKSDIAHSVKKRDFDGKLININTKVTLNKIKHVEAGKTQTDLTKNVAKISEKGYNFLLGRMYFTGDDGYQTFLVFAPILSSLTLDNNKKITN